MDRQEALLNARRLAGRACEPGLDTEGQEVIHHLLAIIDELRTELERHHPIPEIPPHSLV